jgi:hypothetical protein
LNLKEPVEAKRQEALPDYVDKIMNPVLILEGSKLKVSDMNPGGL